MAFPSGIFKIRFQIRNQQTQKTLLSLVLSNSNDMLKIMTSRLSLEILSFIFMVFHQYVDVQILMYTSGIKLYWVDWRENHYILCIFFLQIDINISFVKLAQLVGTSDWIFDTSMSVGWSRIQHLFFDKNCPGILWQIFSSNIEVT